jgi:hypothetical protein
VAAFTDQFANHLVQGGKGTVDFTVMPDTPFTALISNGDVDGIFMDVHTDKCAMLFHDLPPWFWLCVGVLKGLLT